MALQFTAPEQPSYLSDDVIASIQANPGFGEYFTDHMAVADWTVDSGWTNGRLTPYAPFSMEPGSAVLHYAQEIFEGLKAYRHEDGSVWLFRPEKNAERLANSALRLALPQLPVEDFLASVRGLVALDERWVPAFGGEESLYLRPFMIANEGFLGVRAAQAVSYCVIASPVGAYFKGGVAPVDIWVSTQHSRVPTGGTGAAKCGGNYAASLLPQKLAYEQGCSQVLFLDAATHTHIEELGGMNFCFVNSDDELVTPDLNGNILPGITRDSILAVAPELGLKPVERLVELAEVIEGVATGSIQAAFACGTAAVITPIGGLRLGDTNHVVENDLDVVLGIRNHLLDIQYGRREDTLGWMQQVC